MKLSVTFKGEQMRLVDAMRATGCTLQRSTVANRIADGWPLLRAMSLPIMVPKERHGSLRPFPEHSRGQL